VWGASGTLAAGALRRNPFSNAKLVFLPAVIEMLRAFDAAWTGLSGILAYGIYVDFLGGGDQFEFDTHTLIATLAIFPALHVTYLAGAYRAETVLGARHGLGRVCLGFAATLFGLVLLAFLTKTSQGYSRAWAVSWAALGIGGFAAVRAVLHGFVRRWSAIGRLYRKVAIIGASEQGQELMRLISRGDPTIRVVGIFDDRRTRVPAAVGDAPVCGTVADLARHVGAKQVDEIIVAIAWSAAGRIHEIVGRLRQLPVDVRLCPESLAVVGLSLGISTLAGVPMLRVSERPLAEPQLIAKMIEDRLVAAIALALTFPLFLAVALAVKATSRGPALFTQERDGFGGQKIRIYKFRTMYADRCDPSGAQQAGRADARITPVGRFLRRSSLDELPQFINVLKGEMSVVGPRPHPLGMRVDGRLYSEVVGDYALRHLVKPGITGWAQISGLRGPADTQEKLRKRVEYDLHYIDHWSIWFDLKIMALTVIRFFRDKNAY
jgi:polysaccharide biosynthesis protein PslA